MNAREMLKEDTRNLERKGETCRVRRRRWVGRRLDCREQAAKVSGREKKIPSIEKNKMFSHWLQMH